MRSARLGPPTGRVPCDLPVPQSLRAASSVSTRDSRSWLGRAPKQKRPGGEAEAFLGLQQKGEAGEWPDAEPYFGLLERFVSG